MSPTNMSSEKIPATHEQVGHVLDLITQTLRSLRSEEIQTVILNGGLYKESFRAMLDGFVSGLIRIYPDILIDYEASLSLAIGNTLPKHATGPVGNFERYNGQIPILGYGMQRKTVILLRSPLTPNSIGRIESRGFRSDPLAALALAMKFPNLQEEIEFASFWRKKGVVAAEPTFMHFSSLGKDFPKLYVGPITEHKEDMWLVVTSETR